MCRVPCRAVPGAVGVYLLELFNARSRRLLGELPRAEVVAHVAARDGDDVAADQSDFVKTGAAADDDIPF